MKHKLLLFVCSLFLTVSVTSQVTTSNIRGTVVDDQNEPLLGANVVALHAPTGTKYGAITNEDGRFNLLNLRVGGPYEVTISYIGFQSYTQGDVFLTLGKTFNLDVTLASESQTLDEVIVVSDQAGTFGSDRTGAETSVGRRELTRLPTISRSTNDFTRLEPTASGGSFGGRNDQYNNFSLDGAIFNNPFGLDAAQPGGQTDANPISIDAIEQIQVTTAPYDVTLSGFTGASVNAVTKSGTNEFYGTVYGFFRNEDMTGGKIKGEDVFKADLSQSQYGISIGGPIIKNKLFFFANFERDERSDLGSAFLPNRGTGAINESRVLASDFELVSNVLRQVSIGNGQFYDPGRFEGFNFDQESTKGIFKLDWNINDNNRLAVIYNFLDASKEKPAHPTALGFRGPNPTTLQFENAGYQINNKINSVQVELNSTLSDEAINKLQVGYTVFDDFRNPKSTPAPAITLLDESGGSNYIIGGIEPFSINNTLDQKVFQLTNNLNFFKGDHTFTVGISFEKFQFANSFNLGGYGGQGTFFPTGSIAEFRDPSNESDLVAFYQEVINSAISIHNTSEANGTGNMGGWALAETNVGQLAFYAQDEWNVTENFKLTYGVRLDKPLYFDTAEKVRENISRKGGATGTYVPSTPYTNPETGSQVFLDSEKMPSNGLLVAPRVGFNWDVKNDRTLQVRGGTGLFTGRFPFVWLGNQVQGIDVFFYQIIDPDYQWPQVWRTSLGADYKMENGIVFTTDFSFTKDINAAHVQNWGLGAPSQTLNGVDNRPYYSDGDLGNNAYVFSNSDKGRVINTVLKAQKNFDNGLFTSFAYSYLNSKDVNSIEAEITADAFDGNAIAGNANSDVLAFSKYGDTHRFIGVISKAFKTGTTISSFFEYAQGGRYNYLNAGNINNDQVGSRNNDLIYIPTASEINQMTFSGAGQAEAYEAFIQQDDYLNDNRGSYAERYGALAPWRSRWDLKVLQDIKFGNKNTLQLSLDILNLGNLISSDWGVVQIPTNQEVLGVTVDADRNPVYTFDPDLKETFSFDSSLQSRWQAQLGVRYTFN